MELGQKIAGSACQVGMHDFREKFSLLQTLHDYWQQDIPVLIIPKEDVDNKTSETVVASGSSSSEYIPFTDGDAAFIDDAYTSNSNTVSTAIPLATSATTHPATVTATPPATVTATPPAAVTATPPATVTATPPATVTATLTTLSTITVPATLTTTSTSLITPTDGILYSTTIANSIDDRNQVPISCDKSAAVVPRVLREVTNLNVTKLYSSIKIKPRIKRKGHPKGTSSLWPSKKRKFTKGVQTYNCKSDMDKDAVAKDPAKDAVAKDSAKDAVAKDPPGNFSSVRKTFKRIQMPETPAFRSAVQRRAIQCKGREFKGSSTIVEIDDNDISDPTSAQSCTEDWKLLQSKSWINDKLINCGMELLKLRYPHIKGLQDCTLSDTLNFESIDGEFVQILNCDRKNWICVSTVGCQPGKVNVFDSMRIGEIPLSTKEAIASLLGTTRKSISLIVDVQQQSNSYDCGLFALAYASSICDGVDPTTINYKQYNLHPHFLKCLMKGEYHNFPIEPVHRNPGHPLRNSFRVYCTCRLPDSGDDMIRCERCSQWYHYTCVGIELGEELMVYGYVSTAIRNPPANFHVQQN